MKRFSAFTHFVNWLVAIAAGSYLLYWLGLSQWTGQTEPPPKVVAAIGGGALLLLINILWLFLRFITSRSVTYLIFAKEGAGSLKVSVDAIENAINKSATSLPEVVSADVRLILEKEGNMPGRAIAHCVFTDVRNIFGVQESVRQIVAARYQDIFPGEELRVEVIVDQLRTEASGKTGKKKKGKDEPDEDDYFPGPRYPIDE